MVRGRGPKLRRERRRPDVGQLVRVKLDPEARLPRAQENPA